MRYFKRKSKKKRTRALSDEQRVVVLWGERVSWRQAAMGLEGTNTRPIVGGEHATYHFPSFLDQGEHA